MSHFSSKSKTSRGHASQNQPDQFFQAKLTVGQPGDQYEQEADAMADKVVQEKAQDDTIQAQAENKIQAQSIAERVTPLVQRRSDDQKVQANGDEEEQLSMEAEEGESEEAVQMKQQASADPPVGFEQQLNQNSGGEAMDQETLSGMEQSFGADFNEVRVHTDSQAVQMSQAIGAHAFTHGNDIYFNDNQYNPKEDSGQHLLAHELTHTIQQGSSPAIQNSTIQKEGEEEAAPEMEEETGILDESAKTITFDKIPIPGFKLQDHRGTLFSSKAPLKRKNNYLRGNTNQRDGVWREEISTANITTKLNTLYEEHHKTPPTSDTTHVFKAKTNGRGVKPTFIGSADTISKELTTPGWGKDKSYRNFHVDHIVELQLANWNTATWPNTLENMELLDASKNTSSGSVIKGQITEKLNTFREKHGTQYPGGDATFKNNYTLVFNQAEALAGGDGNATENEFWTQDQIERGDHLEPIEVGNLADIGSEGEVRIFPNESGGISKKFVWTGEGSPVRSAEKNWLGKPFRITAKQFVTEGENVENTENLGSISVNIPSSDKTWAPWPEDKVFPVKRYPGSKYAGYLTKQSIKSGLYGLRIKKASPVEILELDLLPTGIEAYGQILPSIRRQPY